MFRTGEWMFQNGEIPTTDPFSFTFKGTDWISVKWLFEIIAYAFASIAGPESISVLQGIVNVMLAFFFIQTTKNLTQIIFDIKLTKYDPILIIGTLLFLFASDYRLVGRPEMFSYLLTSVYLFLFTRYKLKPGKFIFWLIPLQILWVNIHEGFAVGIIMLVVFAIGHVFDSIITKSVIKQNLQQILLATGLAILAVAINPRGFYMFYHPYFLFSVVDTNHYTNEFNSFFYRPGFYFSFKEPFFAIGAFAISILGTGWIFFKNKLQGFTKVSSGYLVMMIALLYLGMTGYRNVIFTLIIGFPIAFAMVDALTKTWKNSRNYEVATSIVYVLPFAFYVAIGSNFYYENFQTKDRYGLAVYSESNPAGAAKFARDNGLSEERCFSDYLTSAYFLWDLKPGFESYIDLRDLDIFPVSFFDEFIRITHFTNYFDDSDSKYNYEYAMLYTWQFPNLHRYLYHSPTWQQVYADNIAVVYVKNNAKNQELIQEFAPDSTNLVGNFNKAIQPKSSAFSNALSYGLWPLYNPRPTEVDSSIMASKYFRIVADYDRAEFHAQNATKNNTSAYQGWNELGSMYLEIVPYKRTPEGQLKYINMANVAFSKGIKIDRTKWDCVFGVANCEYMKGEYAYAIKLYKKAAKLEPENAMNYNKIADCYANLFQQNKNQKDMDNWFENMELALSLDPDNRNLLTKLALAYCQRNECEKAAPLLKNYERTTELTDQDHKDIQNCKNKCSIK